MVVPQPEDARSDAPTLTFSPTYTARWHINKLHADVARIYPDRDEEWRDISWRSPGRRCKRGIQCVDTLFEVFNDVMDAEGLDQVQLYLRGSKPFDRTEFYDNPNFLLRSRDLTHVKDFETLLLQAACSPFGSVELRAGPFAVGMGGAVDRDWFYRADRPFVQLPRRHLPAVEKYYRATGALDSQPLPHQLLREAYSSPERIVIPGRGGRGTAGADPLVVLRPAS